MGWGGSVHCRMLIIEECWKAYRVFCWTRHTYKRSIFPAWCSHLSKTKQNAKIALVRLAFPINAHQNAKCACIPGAVYTSIPSYLPDPPFRFFEGLVPRLRCTLVSLSWQTQTSYLLCFWEGRHFANLGEKCYLYPKCFVVGGFMIVQKISVALQHRAQLY